MLAIFEMKKLALVLLVCFSALSESQDLVETCPSWAPNAENCLIYKHEGYDIHIGPSVQKEYHSNPERMLYIFSEFLKAFDQVFVPGKLNNSPADFLVEDEFNWLQHLSISPWVRKASPDQIAFYLVWGARGEEDENAPCGMPHPGNYCSGFSGPSITINLYEDLKLAQLRTIVYGRAGPGLSSSLRWLITHEFMHFYHDFIVPQGFSNVCIRGFYDDYLQSFHALEYGPLVNQIEFFAVLAQSYFGVGGPWEGGKEALYEAYPEGHDLIFYMVDHYNSQWELVDQHCGE